MPPPTDSSSNHEGADARERFGDRLSETPAPTNAQAQILVTALHNLIIPLIQIAIPNQRDLHNVPFGPEAEDFLSALQKYIVSIIQDRSLPDSEAVNWEELELPVTLSKTQKDKASSEDMTVSNKSLSRVGIDRTVNLEDKNAMISRIKYSRVEMSPFSPFGDVLFKHAQRILRAHVFNTMPIRLLCLKKRGPNLDITLLDRTGIYSYLLPKLKDHIISQFHATSVMTAPEWFTLKQYERYFPRWVSKISQYTILSHTWLQSAPGEVTFDDWYRGDFDLAHPGYLKLINFCRVAVEEYQVTLGWVDTVCINKESSTELDESIRSMYKWYQNAKNCLVYLAETTTLSDMAKDPWFTRGWMLQELLAPRRIAFYGAEWMALGNGLFDDKEDVNIQAQIESATEITPMELILPLSETAISRKMQWAAKREVTRGEDAAYSLMGIFNVSISIAYGEGADLAFIRLIKEILNTAKSGVLDLFNWAGKHYTDTSTLIPTNPAAYLRRAEFNFGRATLIEPLTLTHLGLRIPVVLMPAVPESSNTQYTPTGDYSSNVIIQTIDENHLELELFWNILDTSPFALQSFPHEGAPLGLAFAVLNCGGLSESSILLPKECFAIAILYSHNNGIVTPMGYKRKVPTEDPISFKLNCKRRTSQDDWKYDTVPKMELTRHGMQFLTMYL